MDKLIKTSIALAALVATTATSFGGLLGENYFGAGLGYTRISSTGGVDGWTIGAGANHNLIQDANFGLDLTGAYGYARMSAYGMRASAHSLSVGLVAFTDMDNFKPFAGVSTGWVWESLRGGWYSGSNDSWAFGFDAGVEVAIGDGFSLTPSVSLVRVDDYREWDWYFNLLAHKWINDSVGLGVEYSVSDGPARSNSIMALVTFRY